MSRPFGAVFVAVALIASPAFADRTAKEPSARETRPWANGVSEADRQSAIRLFREANDLLKDSVFVKAADRYRQALKHWDHPAIHYNLVLALLNLDQPEEVYAHLDAAMKYGPDPLDQDKFDQAKAYKNLISKQLVRVNVRCEIAGANVVMDGRPLFTAPGSFTGMVRAGPHTVVASKAGYMTNEVSRTFVGGEELDLELKLFTAEDLTRYRRKMPVWVPWTVLGSGLALAGGGGALHFMAREDFRAFDAGVVACGDENGTTGCVIGADSPLSLRLARGNQSQTFAFVGYAAGAALVTTGAVLALINQPEAYRVTADEVEKGSVTLLPLLSPNATGVFAAFEF